MSTSWDPGQYLRFGDERGRPFEDLMARVASVFAAAGRHPARVVDLGCGPGNMTARLCSRWPEVRVVGVDSSPEMIGQAQTRAAPGLSFVEADLRSWEPDEKVDVLLSCATLQWVPEHVDLFERFIGFLAPGGIFAFQVPGNFNHPSHVLLAELANSERWRDLLGSAIAEGPSSREPDEYLRELLSAGAAAADVWETTYLHMLDDPDPVLEWISGTGLRPVLRALEASSRAEDRDEFLSSYGAALRAAYPPEPSGRTLFPFRRIFAVAASSES